MASQLEVAIPGLEVGEQYVTYRILVSKGESSWSVKRRYQDFVKLHTAIKKASSNNVFNGDVPELPPKKIRMGMSKFAPDFVEERRVGLETYLRSVVSLVDPERLEPLDDFLVYAEHWLREAVEELARISELSAVVKTLRQAADAAASVHTKRTGSGAVGTGARRRAASSDEEDDGGQEAPTANDADLLPLLKDSVRMLNEYAALVRDGAEESEEKTEATSAANAALTSRLRAKQEDIADARQMMEALREARARECDKERAQLALVAAQARTVTAELARVQMEAGALRGLATEHMQAIADLRSSLAEWEKGLVARLEDGAESPPKPVEAGPNPVAQLTGVCDRAESLVLELDGTARKHGPGIALPPTPASKDEGKKKRRAGSEAADGGADGTAPGLSSPLADGVAGLLAGAQLSGPSLQAAVLIQAATADTAGLVHMIQGLAEGRVQPLPKPAPAPAPAPAPVAQPQPQAGPRRGGAPQFDQSSHSPSSAASASTGSALGSSTPGPSGQGSKATGGGAGGRAGAPAGNPFGGSAAPSPAPGPAKAAGNPFGGPLSTGASSASSAPAAAFSGGAAFTGSTAGAEPAATQAQAAPAPAPAPAAARPKNPFGAASTPAPAKPKAGNPFA